MKGLTSSINRFLNSEDKRFAKRTDCNSEECRMKDTSGSCFHYPSRFRREWAESKEVRSALPKAEVPSKVRTHGYFDGKNPVVSAFDISPADVIVKINGVEYKLELKS